MDRNKHNNIAVVGMACRLPGAKDYRELWQNLLSGKNSIQEIPKSRWDTSLFYSENFKHGEKSISKWCGLVEGIEEFDNEFFHISNLEATMMDPQQRILLQEAYRCIEDSAVPLSLLQKSKTSVYVGAMNADYLHRHNRHKLENNRFTILGNDQSLLANRISYHFNLKGESVTLSGASAASLLALHKAKSALVAGECDFALVAGVNLNIDPLKYVTFSQAGMLSRTGQCQSFDEEADGYVPGDGFAVVLLQPLANAKKQRNQVHGVIKGSASNHLGNSHAITAPCREAQASVIREALRDASLSASDINYIETHGSGTPLGDPVEIAALNEVFGQADRLISLGTIKPNIGHLEAAAGIAGVIKTLLMFTHKQIPKNINLKRVNPIIEIDKTPFEIPTENKAWNSNGKLVAGVSGFGIGGTNCHVVLEQASEEELHKTDSLNGHPNFFLLSAKSESSLREQMNSWQRFLASDEAKNLSLPDLCATLANGRQHYDYRYAAKINGTSELKVALTQTPDHLSQCHVKPIALSFAHCNTDNQALNDIPLISEELIPILDTGCALHHQFNSQWAKISGEHPLKKTIHQLATFRSLSKVGINASLLLLSHSNRWAVFILANILTLEEFIQLAFKQKKLSEVSFRYPLVPVYIESQQTLLPSRLLNNAFVMAYHDEIQKSKGKIKVFIARVIRLYTNNTNFQSIFTEWQNALDGAGIQLEPMLNGQTAYETLKPEHASIFIAAVGNAWGNFHKRWGANQSLTALPSQSILINQLLDKKILSKAELVSMLLSNTEELNRPDFYRREADWFELSNTHAALIDSVSDARRDAAFQQACLKLLTSANSVEQSPDFSQQFTNYTHLSMAITQAQDWYELILASWEKGVTIDWTKLYDQESFSKCALPCYEFDRYKFWNSAHRKQGVPDKPQSIDEEQLDQATERSQTQEVAAKLSTIESMIKTTLSQQLYLDPDQIDFSRSFESYGFDSMAYTILCEAVNQRFSLSLTPATFYGFQTITQLNQYIHSSTSASLALSGEQDSQHGNQPVVNNVTPGSESTSSNEIAIVGYSGIFPQADDIEKFWNNLVNEVDCISEIPPSRWDWKKFYSKDITEADHSPSKWGGFIDTLDQFDARFFGVSATEAKLMDPQQRIVLLSVWRALESAGIDPLSLKSTDASVYIGASTSDYEELIRQSGLAAHASTGMNRALIANRVSFLLDLHGPSEVVDTACSSSLVAVHKAIMAIRSRQTSFAIVGGVNALITPTHYISYGKAGMLSPDGRCKTFDKNANGYVRGEGVGIVLLKPLAKAIEDKDIIHAVIKASGVNHGGRANSLTAPNPNAQAKLIREVYESAGIDPASIDLIENHGTGTPLGDPIEINALKQVFNKAPDSAQPFNKASKCYLGSVKTNIGHLEAAAGIAGLIKLLLSLKNEQMPASLHYQNLNPQIDLSNSPFEILNTKRDWPRSNKTNGNKRKRRAGISSFGFGGVNAHLVLEEFEGQTEKETADLHNNNSDFLLVLSAKSESVLSQYVASLLQFLKLSQGEIDCEALAYTSQVGRSAEKYRLATCFHSVSELQQNLIEYISGNSDKKLLNNKRLVTNLERSFIDKEQSQSRLNSNAEDLISIAKAWVSGLQVDWSQLYLGKTPVRIQFPGYPFELKTFWVDPKSHLGSTAKILAGKSSPDDSIKILHDKLGRKSLELVKEFSIKNSSFIATEHIINKQAISPGIYCLDLIAVTLQDYVPSSDYLIKDLTWLNPIVFAGESTKLLVEVNEVGHYLEVTISYLTPPNVKQLHAIAKVVLTNLTVNESLATKSGQDPSGLVASPWQALPLNKDNHERNILYSQLARFGFEYGETFQVITNLTKRSEMLVCRLELPSNTHTESQEFLFHPGLMDGILQACVVYIGFDSGNCYYLPITLEGVHLFSKIQSSVEVKIQPHGKHTSNDELRVFSAIAYDCNGFIVARIERASFKRIDLHQVDSAISDKKINGSHLPTSPIIKPVMSQNIKGRNTEKSSVNIKALSKQTVNYFLAIISKAVSVDSTEIDVKQPFKEYGVDSFLTLSIVRGLEADFGELRKTLLFEATNIEELAELFIEEHQDRLIEVIGYSESSESSVAEASVRATHITDDIDLSVKAISNDKLTQNEQSKPVQQETLVLEEFELSNHPVIESTVEDLLLEYGKESIALSRKDIAPFLFINANRKSFFYFNVNGRLLLAFRFVGPQSDFASALDELNAYCNENNLLLNVLCEYSPEQNRSMSYSANPFGVIQRLTAIDEFSLQGGQMRRLRYHVNKFTEAGTAITSEYQFGEDCSQDDAVEKMIEKWASLKSGVNPYIWRVKDELQTGCLKEDYRVFLTHLDNTLQNVIIISRIASDNSYLLDTEFYSNEMVTGGLEFAIWEIIKKLQGEGCQAFNLGLTFGGDFFRSEYADPLVEQHFQKLKEQSIFNETGNFQFKNKFRTKNVPLYLYRTKAQPADNITDLIMMIGNPKSFKKWDKISPVSNQPVGMTRAVALVEADELGIELNDIDSVAPLSNTTEGFNAQQTRDELDSNDSSTRSQLLHTAGFNPFNLQSSSIEFDLATDSWSELAAPFIRTRTQHLCSQQRQNQSLEEILAELFAMPYVLAFASGRVAESYFCAAWPTDKKHVLQNVLFPTCLFHQIDNDFYPIEAPHSEFHNRDSNYLFKGNINLQVLEEKLSQFKNDIAFVWVELCNNASGGAPVSIQNLKDVKNRLGEIPLILDATRIIENAYCIQAFEQGYQNASVWSIVAEIVALADGLNASLTKDFCTPTGGIFATKNQTLYKRIQDAVSTGGSGLSHIERDMISVAMVDKNHIAQQVKQRMQFAADLAGHLQRLGVTTVLPVSGHCILIDPKTVKPFDTFALPVQSFISWLYQHAGIRVAPHSVGRQSNTSMNNLIRIAVPVGLTTESYQAICNRIKDLFATNSIANDLTLIERPDGLFGEMKAKYASRAEQRVNPLVHLNTTAFRDNKSDGKINTFGERSAMPEKSIHSASRLNKGSEHEASKANHPVDNAAKNRGAATHTSNPGPVGHAQETITDIAVIGMSGRYPKAKNLEEFWQQLINGQDCVTENFDWSSRFNPQNAVKHRGGFIEDVDKFDSLFFSISPREAKNMDPQERLFMETAWHAVEDAGYFPEKLVDVIGSRSVGVFVGAVWSYYEMLGAENRLSGGQSIANSQHWGISNRVSAFMNFNGPSLTVDTACSSSLSALHLACESIRSGESKAAIVGGVNLDLHPSKHHITKAAQFLSDDGLCKAFGKDGSGYVAGEGVGAFLLKPLKQAEADGDHIYGVIKSTASNHGGRTSGYTVPSPKAQAELIRSAISKAGISAESISYIEAHGTGTELGDPIEIEGASKAFRSFTQDKQFCAIGSVKTNIGHLEAAAGIAGATKLLLQMTNRTLVPSLHAEEQNEHINFADSPFYVQKELSEWLPRNASMSRQPLRAGLSSFGAGGTNVHVIFEEYPARLNASNDSKSHIFVLSARKQDTLKDYANSLISYLLNSQVDLEQLAYTLQNGRVALSERLAIVATKPRELIDKLKSFVDGQQAKDVFASSSSERLSLELFDGEEREQVLKVFISNRSLDKIARLWVSGLEIRWDELSDSTRPQRISAPVYPFNKVSHWIAEDIAASQTHQVTAQYNRSLHPLIDENVSTFKNIQFKKQFNLEQFEFKEHIVNQLPTLPGVAYMEMALAAGSYAFDKPITQLNNLIWASPINSQGGKDIRIRLTNAAENANYEISTTINNLKQVHAQGKVSLLTNGNSPDAKYAIDDLKSRCKKSVSKVQCYDLLATRNLTYGPNLQTIESFSYSGNEGLTSVRLPKDLAGGFNQYIAHPAILDGAVQSIICLLEYCNAKTLSGVPYVPFVLKQLKIIKPVTKLCYAYLRLIENEKSREDIKLIDIDILDNQGNVLVEMSGFSFKAVEQTNTTNSDQTGITSETRPAPKFEKPAKDLATDLVYYNHHWVISKQSHPLPESQDNRQAIVVLDAVTPIADLQRYTKGAFDECILVSAGTEYQKMSRNQYVINPTREQDYQVLISHIIEDDFVPANWLHHWSWETFTNQLNDLERQIDTAIISVVQLVKTLLKQKKAISARQLNFVYAYQQEDSTTFNHPVFSAINGCLLSAKQEGANLNCKTVRMSQQHFEHTADSYWSKLLAEFNQFEDMEVSVTADNRLVRKARKISVDSKPADGVALIKSGGVYLITGGAGGLGKLFADSLLSQQDVSLVLTGRSAITADTQKMLDAMSKQGANVFYQSCDVTVEAQVEKLIDFITSKFSRLDGIIHCAGIIKDGFIWNKDAETFAQVLSPKVQASFFLDKATSDLDLDFFVLCSSIASVLGNMGQSDYATANRFMDELAGYRNQLVIDKKRSGKTVSINWPLWRNGGMQVNEQAEKWLFETWGMKPLETSLGINALFQSISMNESCVGLVSGDLERLKHTLGITASVGEETTRGHQDKIVSRKASDEIKLVQSQTQDYLPLLKSDLTQMVIDLLGIQESDISFTENMSHFGFDSVTFTEFANLINQRLSLDVTPLIFFEQETLQQLVDYLIEDFESDLIQHFGNSNTLEPVDEERPEAQSSSLDETETRLDDWPSFNESTAEETTSEEEQEYKSEPIAIIGMSGIMPQSKDLDTFWQNLVNKKNLVTEIPEDRWDWKKYWGEPDIGNSKTKIKWGGFIPEVDKFDAEFFKISPLEAELTDPQQRLFLETVWHTIEDAGYKASELNGSNTGVFVGIGTSDYHELLREQQSDFEAYSVMGWMHAVLANRISYYFNWSGPSEPIGTACSSSLVAIDRAVQAIRSGRCNLCVAGGISLLINPGLHIGLGKAEMLSPDGRCKTFDHRANGYVRSEGTGAILLKPLKQAIKDKDNIYAVIRGSAVNHGGHVNTFTTPNPKAQTEVIQMALDDAGIDPATLSYIEAHGTGTALGDPIEIQGLLKVFKNQANKSQQMPIRQNYCALGSVKTNVGHLELAAGMAGIFKLGLALKHKKIPASINFETVNPYIKLTDTPLRLVTETQDWETPFDRDNQPVTRRAGISSFGFGGVNAHLILEEFNPLVNAVADPLAIKADTQEFQVIPLSVKYEQGLSQYVQVLFDFITLHEQDRTLPTLNELANVFQFGREEFNKRIAFVCRDYTSLKSALNRYLNAPQPNSVIADPADHSSPTAEKCFSTANTWVTGQSVDWSLIATRGNKVSAPVYPFKRDRYWLLQDDLRGVFPSNTMDSTTEGGPAKADSIGISDDKISIKKNASKDPDKVAFEIRVDETSRYFNDHKIAKQNLLPAAAYLEIASAAIYHEFGTQVAQMVELMWVRPLTLASLSNPLFLELEVNEEVVEFSFLSRHNEQSEYYCQGNAKLSVSSMGDGEKDLDEILDFKSSGNDSCYVSFSELGFEYGPSLNVIQQLMEVDGKIYAQLQLSEQCLQDSKRNPYHTAVLDGALQAMLGINTLAKGGDKIRVPVLASKVEIIDELSLDLTVIVKPTSQASSGEAFAENILKIFDLEVYNSSKKLCLHFKGIEVRPLVFKEKNLSMRPQVEADSINRFENNSELETATKAFLKQLLATESKRNLAEIDERASFESYGIDSFLALRMTKKLEQSIGPISKSSFFEYATIQSLAVYLCEQYAPTLATHLGIKAENENVKGKDKPLVDGQVSVKSIDNGPNSLLSFLCELIASETKRPMSEIETETSFEHYGIDSFLALRMTKKLEAKLGPISKSTFFEYKNLNDLADYLAAEYAETVQNVFADSTNITEAINNNDNGLHALRSQLLVFLQALLSSETKKDKSSIADDAVFAELGVDSFLALRMTKKLENAIGPISKSIFFEQTNLVDFVDYMLENHEPAITAYFASNSTATDVAATLEAVAVPKPVEYKYRVIVETELDNHPVLKTKLNKLQEQFGMENRALARQVIAPMLFINKLQDAYFNFNVQDKVALAFTYVGPEDKFENTCVEFIEFCRKSGYECNVLSELGLTITRQDTATATPFGVMQRITELNSISLTGSKMRRLRYQISKFENAGSCQFEEYINGSDSQVDAAIGRVIDSWCENKQMVNPYIKTIRQTIIDGKLSRDYRIFLTQLDGELQNVIIITPMPSTNGYLMDLEFYPADMPLGGLEYAIWNIIQQLKREGYASFSLGATFGVLEGDNAFASDSVAKELENLQSQGAFDGTGNFQFKNKFRPDNRCLYLIRPRESEATNVVDVLMLIANPQEQVRELDLDTAK